MKIFKNIIKKNKNVKKDKQQKKVKLIDIFDGHKAILIETHFLNYEYDNIVEGNWTYPYSDGSLDDESIMFLNMSEKQAEIYSFERAKEYASNLANYVEELLRMYGNDYFVDVLHIDLEKELNRHLEIKNNVKDLERKMVILSLKKLKVVQVWSDEVDRINDETIAKENARQYLSQNEYELVDELVYLDYLREEPCTTFTLGRNKESSYLREIAHIFTLENNLITEQANDFYEVGKQQGEVTLKYFSKRERELFYETVNI